MGRLAALASGLVLCACTPEPTPSAKATSEQVPVPSEPRVEVAAEPVAEAAIAPPEFDPSLGERFTAAVQGYEHGPAEPRERGPSWRAPDCELEYEFRVQVGNLASGPAGTVMIAGSWTALAGAPGMIVKNGVISIGQAAGSERHTSAESPAGSFAELRLQTDGRSWTEVDGPTALWSAYGNWNGLVTFYPALPESGASGSSVDWPLQIHERRASARVEGERGSLEVPEGVTLAEPKPTERMSRVTLERWIEVEGTRAAVLRSWSELDNSEDDLSVHVISQGQYVVLESGVLLHAELRERTKYETGAGEQAVTSELATDGEARLVRSCAKPVLPRFVSN